jgi:hypothetical protein
MIEVGAKEATEDEVAKGFELAVESTTKFLRGKKNYC